MVLHKRKPVLPIPKPDLNDETDQIYHIPETNEVFTNHQKFLERQEFYMQKQFSCEITGHMNLTFFEAQASEAQHAQEVEGSFPEALKEPVLRKVQFSVVSRIDALVDQLHEAFKSDFYPGEHVTAILDNGERVEALVREKTMFPELKTIDGAIQRKGFSRYMVKMVNRNDDEAQVDNEHIIRDKKTFTKAMLRSFLKNTMNREPWTGAPWIVKEDFAVRYKIPRNVPQHLQRAHKKPAPKKDVSVTALVNGSASPTASDSRPKSHKSKQHQAHMEAARAGGTVGVLKPSKNGMGTASGSPFDSPAGTPDTSGLVVKPYNRPLLSHQPTPKPPPIKYPIEDLDVVPKEDNLRPRLLRLSDYSIDLPAPQLPDGILNPPNPTCLGIREDTTAFVLSTWVFLNIYCEPLILDSFTFDDYLQALYFTSDEIECSMFVEINCSLLKCIVSDGGYVMAQIPDVEAVQESESEEEDPEVQMSGIVTANDVVQVNGAARVASRSPGTVKERRHRAAELFEDRKDWIDRLKVRDFKNGGWQVIVAGLMYQLTFDKRFAKDAEPVVEHLVPLSEETPTEEAVEKNYRTMDINLRVMAIHLMSRLVHETRSVKDYMEECSEEMTSLRKDKIEIQREKKALLNTLNPLEDERKILLPENTPRSPSPQPPSRQDSTDADGDSKMNGVDTPSNLDEEEDEEDIQGPGGRSLRLKNAKRKRDDEGKFKADEKKAKLEAQKLPKSAKEFQKIVKKIEGLKKQTNDCEEKIKQLDEELRQADCQRFKKLGYDRFWNTYWWFERNGMPFGGLPDASTAVAGYANAMLWIQGPDESVRQGFIVQEVERQFPSAKAYSARTDQDGDALMMDGQPLMFAQLASVDRQAHEENGTTLFDTTQYGYIDTPEGMDALMKFLDVRGVREKKLVNELSKYKDKIVIGMRHRQAYIHGGADTTEDDSEKRTRTRGKAFDTRVWRCLNWTNDSMINEQGHLHIDQPEAKKKGGKKKKKKGTAKDDKGKEVPLNRQGKPISRQGERYNFN